VAVSKAYPERQIQVFTNAQGIARFQLNDRGAYLIKCVYMIPASKHLNADWESFWASLTFTLSDS